MRDGAGLVVSEMIASEWLADGASDAAPAREAAPHAERWLAAQGHH